MFNREELKSILGEYITTTGRMSKKWCELIKNDGIMQSIKNNVDRYDGNNVIEMIYWIYYDIYDYNKCYICGGNIKGTFISFVKGYRNSNSKYCGPRCVGIGTKSQISKTKCIDRQVSISINEDNILDVIKNNCFDNLR